MCSITMGMTRGEAAIRSWRRASNFSLRFRRIRDTLEEAEVPRGLPVLLEGAQARARDPVALAHEGAAVAEADLDVERRREGQDPEDGGVPGPVDAHEDVLQAEEVRLGVRVVHES